MTRPLLVLALLLVAACGNGRSGTTVGGHYDVSYTPVPEAIPYNELFALKVDVTDNGGGGTEAVHSLQLKATMPAHGHGMTTAVSITQSSSGHYLIEGMKFHMRGDWQLVFTVDGSPGVDTVTFTETLE